MVVLRDPRGSFLRPQGPGGQRLAQEGQKEGTERPRVGKSDDGCAARTGGSIAGKLRPPPRVFFTDLQPTFPGVPLEFVGQKIGLALSGGGFRASLFHIGVLARLADMGLLGRIEVLSCVSGGSIIGAYYYLAARQLLETRSDAEIGQQDYVRLIRDLKSNFLEGVQSNLRMRVFSSPVGGFKVLFSGLTRTRLLGRLFEQELFDRVGGDRTGEFWLNDLTTTPADDSLFHPYRRNWRRSAKVPVLVLNATTLNTGHLWQFTATWMGEPSGNLDPTVDRRERLQRVYYKDVPKGFERVRLGDAVAASSCVPGLFEPYVLDGLYPNHTIGLVDGGVYDNQGVDGLLLEDCSHIIVSDASGPLVARNELKGSRISAPVRSNAITMSIVRDRQHRSLHALESAGAIKEVSWIHLFDEIGYGGVVSADRKEGEGRASFAPPREAVQRALGEIRTDLDSFSQAEAYALMTSGYRMVERSLADSELRCQAKERIPDWDFLEIEPMMECAPGYEEAHKRLLALLDAGNKTFFKAWRISPLLRVTAVVLAVLVLFGAAFAISFFAAATVRFTVGQMGLGLGVIAALVLTFRQYARWTRGKTNVTELAVSLVSLIAWIPAKLHLLVFDRWFLRLGRFERLRSLVNERTADLRASHRDLVLRLLDDIKPGLDSDDRKKVDHVLGQLRDGEDL